MAALHQQAELVEKAIWISRFLTQLSIPRYVKRFYMVKRASSKLQHAEKFQYRIQYSSRLMTSTTLLDSSQVKAS